MEYTYYLVKCRKAGSGEDTLAIFHDKPSAAEVLSALAHFGTSECSQTDIANISDALLNGTSPEGFGYAGSTYKLIKIKKLAPVTVEPEMKIWVLTSVANDYNQPENNLMAWWPQKPAAAQVAAALTVTETHAGVEQLMQTGRYTDILGNCYALHEIGPGVLK